MSTNSDSIRLALCITDLDVGGAERHLVELVRRLDRTRFDPVVYCLAERPYRHGGTLARELDDAGIKAHYLGARSVLQFAHVLRQLTSLLREQQPHVVQSFLLHANVVAALAGRRAGVRKIVTGIRVAERRKGWHLRLARWADQYVDRHVCVSQSVAEYSRVVARLPEEKLLVIPNGVDVDRFAMAAPCSLDTLGISTGRRVFTFIGRLDDQKGVDWLLELCPVIFKHAPDHDLLVVGEGADRARLESLSDRAGIASRVRFVGWRAEIPSILAASDLLVLPSRWEGMPNVVLEAMAARRPVVATDVEGVRDLLGPQAELQIVGKDDAQLFVQRVVSLLCDKPHSDALGRGNQARARQFFSLEAMVEKYAKLYESLVETREILAAPR